MEFDNQGTTEQWKAGDRSDMSDFSESESTQVDKKTKKDKIILGSKKKDKEKKKEKETRYATLGDDSSGEEESKKKNKKKGFQFGSAKKEKKEKKDRETKECKELRKKEKKEKEKQKTKLKKIKGEGDIDLGKGKVEEVPVFGVPLSKAVERSRCHDGIKLPVVVRECIDFIEENGLKVEGIYRSSGVKSKVNKLKVLYNTRQSVSLTGSEPAVVASLLKLFLRELPDPVLTQQLMLKFEEVSSTKEKDGAAMLTGLRDLVHQLPECNRTLLEWIFVHMEHVIQHEKQNKMTLQNVSIVLSPTMQISHRVLYCLFKHSKALFGHVQIKKYVPPISGQGGVNLLPESPEGIEEEMKKQESLLEDLHKEISLGVASKEIEEQLWEQQRIVTQLKRKLRLAKSQLKNGESKPELEEELNFSLQTPVSTAPSFPGQMLDKSKESDTGSEMKPTPVDVLSSPDEKGDEHRVTVQIHQSENLDTEKGHVTVIQLDEKDKSADVETEENKSKLENPEHLDKKIDGGVKAQDKDPLDSTKSSDSKQLDTTKSSDLTRYSDTSKPPDATKPSDLTRPKESSPGRVSQTLEAREHSLPSSAQVKSETRPAPSRPDAELSQRKELSKNMPVKPATYENIEPKSKKVDFKPEPTSELSRKKEIRINISVEDGTNKEENKQEIFQGNKPQGFPLIPPPPASSKLSCRGLLKPTVLPRQEIKMKSKSLPRGLPSDIATYSNNKDNNSNHTKTYKIESDHRRSEERSGILSRENLLWEELRLKYEYEELLNLKSELERKKKTERREIAELQEEIATMQTLYQYRTYSVDSSEDSDIEEEKKQMNEDNRILLRQLAREQADLEQKKSFLLSKLENERKICLQLRVQIRLEQERLKRKGL